MQTNNDDNEGIVPQQAEINFKTHLDFSALQKLGFKLLQIEVSYG